jgi:uncharacterized protein YecT (DUF1311 family)
MNTQCRYLAAVVAFVVPTLGQAEEAQLSRPFADCMDRSGGVTMAMMDCIGAETQLQDDRLNRAYKALIVQLTAKRKAQLQQAQRAWITFRDANCGFYFDAEGGTLARVVANDCVMTMTAARAKELENLLP